MNNMHLKRKEPCAMDTNKNQFKTLEEFWPFYLGEHSWKLNRSLHFIGSGLGLVFLVLAVVLRMPLLILGGFVCGYAFAWIGHFFIEKNRPATFKYPLKSFISDWKMFYYILTGRIDEEFKRLNLVSR